MAILSKKLATIILNVPVELDEQEVIVKDLNKEFLRDLLKN